MNADDRLTALKKAYADIILNTAKEAAARILVSERKALRFQHELFAAKEESLQMLLRLKRMMDSKTSEAELASLSQQKKIEELELQLQEAEDIVKDLRDELREVQDKLERVAKKEVTHLNHGTVAPLETSANNRPDVSQSIVLPPPDFERAPVSASDLGNLNINQGNEGQKIINSLVRLGNSYIANSDLPSIILRSKEPELYRNGCTQRVRACERTPLDRELSFSDKVNDEKNDSAIREEEEEEEEGERVCKPLLSEPDNKRSPEKNDVDQDDRMVASWQQVRVVKSLRKKRKRTTRFTKIRNPSCRYQPDQINKINQSPGVSFLNYCSSGKDNFPSREKGTFDMAQRKFSDTDGRCDTKTECTGRSEAPTVGKVDLPLVGSESKGSETTGVIPLHPVNDRVIKYTFQRKRKRQALNSSEGSAREKFNSDEGSASVGKKENGSLEPENSNLIEESSRDRRLSQVARQLVSLSGKKW